MCYIRIYIEVVPHTFSFSLVGSLISFAKL